MLYQVTHFLCCISTHDLTGRSTEEGDMCSLLNTFQLTTSRGGRLRPEQVRQCYLHFNSRPHEEVDYQDQQDHQGYRHFNSRPHEEVDCDL